MNDEIDIYAYDLENEFTAQDEDLKPTQDVDPYDSFSNNDSEDKRKEDDSVLLSSTNSDLKKIGEAVNAISHSLSLREGRLNPGRRFSLYIGNLTWWTTDEDIMAACSTLGVTDVIEIKFYENRVNGQSKGFAAVHFASSASSRLVVEKLSTLDINGQKPSVVGFNKQNLTHLDNQSKSMIGDLFEEETSKFITEELCSTSEVVGGISRRMKEPPCKDLKNVFTMKDSRCVISGATNLLWDRHKKQNLPNSLQPQATLLNSSVASLLLSGSQQLPVLNPSLRISQPLPPLRFDHQMDLSMPPPSSFSSSPASLGAGVLSRQALQLGGHNILLPHDARNNIRNPASPLPRHHLNDLGRPQNLPSGVPYPPPIGIPPPSIQALRSYSLLPNSQGSGESFMSRHTPSLPPSAHINPAFFTPPNVNSPASALSLINNLHPPPSLDLSSKLSQSLSRVEFDEIFSRNKSVSSSAITRAISDASMGDYTSAMETLVTAISLIKQSKISNDERCKLLISSLQDTLKGIECKSYRNRSRERLRSPSRGRDDHRDKRKDRRRRERSRSRDKGSRHNNSDRYYDDYYDNRDDKYNNNRRH